MTAHAKMRLKVSIVSRQRVGHTHEVGAQGIVVEALGPRAWLVEVRVPDTSLLGGAWYETLDVYAHEFEVIEEPAS